MNLIEKCQESLQMSDAQMSEKLQTDANIWFKTGEIAGGVFGFSILKSTIQNLLAWYMAHSFALLFSMKI